MVVTLFQFDQVPFIEAVCQAGRDEAW